MLDWGLLRKSEAITNAEFGIVGDVDLLGSSRGTDTKAPVSSIKRFMPHPISSQCACAPSRSQHRNPWRRPLLSIPDLASFVDFLIRPTSSAPGVGGLFPWEVSAIARSSLCWNPFREKFLCWNPFRICIVPAARLA